MFQRDTFLPCGVIVCIGLAGDLTFHIVKVPSEWLQINCFPSWCQATEWIAYGRQVKNAIFKNKNLNTKLFIVGIVINFHIKLFHLSQAEVNVNCSEKNNFLKPSLLPMSCYKHILLFQYSFKNHFWQPRHTNILTEVAMRKLLFLRILLPVLLCLLGKTNMKPNYKNHW